MHQFSQLVHLVLTAAATDPSAPPPAQSSPFSLFFMLGGVVLVMYFLMIRPQQKREKTRQAMISQLKTGDKVMTSSGIIGEIVEINEMDATLRVDPRKDVRIKVRRAAVAGPIGDSVSEDTVKESTGG